MNEVEVYMFISKSQVQNILKTYSKQFSNNQVNKTGEAKKVNQKDNLVISSESKVKQKIMQSIRQSDDIRLDKVKEFKEKIATGTYTVSDDEVAEKMITKAIVDHLI